MIEPMSMKNSNTPMLLAVSPNTLKCHNKVSRHEMLKPKNKAVIKTVYHMFFATYSLELIKYMIPEVRPKVKIGKIKEVSNNKYV